MSDLKGLKNARDIWRVKLMERAKELTQNSQALLDEMTSLRQLEGNVRNQLKFDVKKDDVLLEQEYLPFTERAKVERNVKSLVNQFSRRLDALAGFPNKYLMRLSDLDKLSTKVDEIEPFMSEQQKSRLRSTVRQAREYNENSDYSDSQVDESQRFDLTSRLNKLLGKLEDPEYETLVRTTRPAVPKPSDDSKSSDSKSAREVFSEELLSSTEEQVGKKTAKQLKNILKAFNTKGYSKDKKPALIDRVLRIREDLRSGHSGSGKPSSEKISNNSIKMDSMPMYEPSKLLTMSLPEVKEIASEMGIPVVKGKNKKSYVRAIKKIQDAKAGIMKPRKKRELTEAQRQELRDRLAKARAVKASNAKSKGSGKAKPSLTGNKKQKMTLDQIKELLGGGIIDLEADL